MSEKPEILCVGHDSVLNRTRRMILERCFAVTLAQSLSEAIALLTRRRFALVLLCHSLTDDDWRSVVDFIHSLQSPVRILVLGEERSQLLLAAQDEEFASGGPAELLQKAVAMTGIAQSDAERCAADEPARNPEKKLA
jgi:DNA-binding NtrC family response regulator